MQQPALHLDTQLHLHTPLVESHAMAATVAQLQAWDAQLRTDKGPGF